MQRRGYYGLPLKSNEDKKKDLIWRNNIDIDIETGLSIYELIWQIYFLFFTNRIFFVVVVKDSYLPSLEDE